MAEYIDREVVLSKCDDIWNAADETTQTGVDTINTIDEVVDFIESLPSADVHPVDRWISVEDRLPEVDKQVLVYIKKPDDNHDNVEKAHLSDKSDDEYPYWVFENGRFYSTRFRYATHWQPVPKPPKDGDIE